MLAISIPYYNISGSIGTLGGRTLAMVAGLTDYVWTASDLLALDMWAGAQAA